MFLEFVLLGQSDQGKRAASDVVLLPPGTHPDGAYAIAVTESWMDVVPLGPTVAIEALCRKLLDMIERFGSALSLPFFQAEARRAFDLLLRPIWSRAGVAMETVRHLVIATDGVLNLLPLDLLVDEMREARSWRDFDYLIRRFSTEYTASATVFVDLRQGRYRRGQPGGTFVGVGDPAYSSAERPPLPGTRREIATIAALVGGFKRAPSAEPVVLLDVNARKDRLSDPQLLKEAEYIHLACHGTAGKHPYSDGALFFAESERGDRRDSVLTTRHVMDLRTSAKLVVMSACESGLGKLTRGEGIQGLVRAWLFAGARSVIASMWEVDDDPAAEFMESVYRALLDSAMTTADALAAAKRSAIEDERLACPVFWAAFVVFGGGSKGAPRERAATHGELFVIPDRLPHVTADAAAIGRHEREILGHQLAPLALQNKKVVYGLLFRCSAQTLLDIAADSKHLGAEIGFFSVLHTWNQKLQHHPHVHSVVPAGGLSGDHSQWVRPRNDRFFLPERVLSEVFRGKFLEALQQAHASGELQFHGLLRGLSKPGLFRSLIRQLYSLRWVVYCKPLSADPSRCFTIWAPIPIALRFPTTGSFPL